MTTTYVEQQFMGKLVTAAVALGLQVRISFGLVFPLFEYRFMRPLRQLLDDAKRLASGELTQPVAVLRHDEMGTLAQRLDTVRENLNEKISHVHGLNATLEQRVAAVIVYLGGLVVGLSGVWRCAGDGGSAVRHQAGGDPLCVGRPPHWLAGAQKQLVVRHCDCRVCWYLRFERAVSVDRVVGWRGGLPGGPP